MIIKYIGHACFKIRDNETGYSIIFDPYQPNSIPGYHDIVDASSEVRCSHEHFDHNAREVVKLEPRDDSPYEVRVIDTWHDAEKGKHRGENHIHIVTDKKTGERIIHYGDIGEVLDDLLSSVGCVDAGVPNLDLLKDADVALIPVGGTYTYDADEAIELIRRTTPKLVIPMHYKIAEGYGFSNIGTIGDFADKAQKAGMKVRVAKVAFYDTANALDNCILVVRPQNL